ncbi:Gfo/Idh/MocA family protein [Rugosimonospora africana]|uniref:Dehydrogenase n=1 Tax=Rugosimonospora africana TaxID=556532 RepID=A0A8J3VSN8_9ACTN|nr:dehydrogenase [Rugosimonospora africana]
MFVKALAVNHAATAELVALCDVNPVRLNAHNRLLASLGAAPAATYPVESFGAMLDKESVDVVLVTSVDRTHDDYIVGALEAGRDVISEKPMTIDARRCRRILNAVARTGRHVTVTFNYRYNPVHEAVRRLLAAGEIGEIGSVHFEWQLDLRHGADYFRRWHREKANSGGLMVHKSSHHFDLVNWWLGARPVEVFGMGRLFFYGEQGARHGYDRGYSRAHGDPAAVDDPFALHLAGRPRLRELYLDAESEDGYLRDRNVFAPGVTIEDDMAVLVRYDTGATMTYHLSAYSPWEGYRVMFNGSRGRLELEVVESDHVDLAAAGEVKGDRAATRDRALLSDPSGSASVSSGSAALHGVEAASERGWVKLSVRPFWAPPYDVDVPGYTREGHGGADARMTDTIFGGSTEPDPLGRGATARDGALSLLTGLAANESFDTGRPVRVADVLDIP